MRDFGSVPARRTLAWLCLAALALAGWAGLSAPAAAQSGAPLKIGILNDASGIVADLSGEGSWAAADMAVEDFGQTVLGRPIQLLKGDHQSKADIGLALARKWYDEDVKAIFDVGITTVAIGVQQLARDKNRIVVFNSTGTVDLTGKLCSPNGIHWTYDSYAYAVGAARANMQGGLKSWYFLTADYVYGQSLQAEATRYAEAHGGKVLGSSRHPFETKDFSSDLLKAQGSGAELIGLATPTLQAATIIKQAAEFGIKTSDKTRVVPIGVLVQDVKGIGLPIMQGLYTTEPYYWDLDEPSRAFAKRYFARTGKQPNSYQASVYGAITHYLNAVKSAGTDQTEPVLKAMRDTKVNDFMTKDGYIRPDGRTIRDFYVFRVKAPAQSKGDWDLLERVATIPGPEAFKTPDPACPLVK